MRKLYEAYQVVIAIKVLQVGLDTLKFMSVSKPLGILIITIGDMIHDLLVFVQLFLVVTGAFMFAGTALQARVLMKGCPATTGCGL